MAGLIGAALGVGPAGASGDWSWQRPHAVVKPKGDLEWNPEPFRFEAGASVRYIDFAGGDDASDGKSRVSAWRHHPWDANAAGAAAGAEGVHTYVFKRGAVYRGTLRVKESGRPGEPVRLTSDPEWGRGEAVLCGSEAVTRWKRGADHPAIPEPEKVWYAELDFAPRCVWVVGKRGRIARIPLARTPNWKVSDPDDVKKEWWHWNYPTGMPFDVFTEKDGRKPGRWSDTVVAGLSGPAFYLVKRLRPDRYPKLIAQLADSASTEGDAGPERAEARIQALISAIERALPERPEQRKEGTTANEGQRDGE